jgi:dynein heavy chain
LDKALPMLDAAVKCLSELNKAHIDEVRNFKKPPAGVVLTMEAACQTHNACAQREARGQS